MLVMYILTGSHPLSLHTAISQSLAGRIFLLTLMPLTLSELSNKEGAHDVSEYIVKVFYPRPCHESINVTDDHRNYIQIYLERDVRQ